MLSRLKCDRLPDPLKVFETSDNENSLFRSISILLFGNENCTYRLRLAAVEDGLTNCSTYITHVQVIKRSNSLSDVIFKATEILKISFLCFSIYSYYHRDIFVKSWLACDSLNSLNITLYKRRLILLEPTSETFSLTFLQEYLSVNFRTLKKKLQQNKGFDFKVFQNYV